MPCKVAISGRPRGATSIANWPTDAATQGRRRAPRLTDARARAIRLTGAAIVSGGRACLGRRPCEPPASLMGEVRCTVTSGELHWPWRLHKGWPRWAGVHANCTVGLARGPLDAMLGCAAFATAQSPRLSWRLAAAAANPLRMGNREIAPCASSFANPLNVAQWRLHYTQWPPANPLTRGRKSIKNG